MIYDNYIYTYIKENALLSNIPGPKQNSRKWHKDMWVSRQRVGEIQCVTLLNTVPEGIYILTPGICEY